MYNILVYNGIAYNKWPLYRYIGLFSSFYGVFLKYETCINVYRTGYQLYSAYY